MFYLVYLKYDAAALAHDCNDNRRVVGTNMGTPEQEIDLQLAGSPPQTGGMERVEHSIASTVVLRPHLGTATKTFRAPFLVRLLYWCCFQARFPYEHNKISLEAAIHRRTIAGLISQYRFGRNLVAPALSVQEHEGKKSLVTEYVPGEKVSSQREALQFLNQVAPVFAQIGLSVWQVSPRNPHAYTNLVQTTPGEFTIIDLESALVTPFPPKGQFRAFWKNGFIPVFDDINFVILRQYLEEHQAELDETLGPSVSAKLRNAVDSAEQAIGLWKKAELRLWGKLARFSYFMLDWKGLALSFSPLRRLSMTRRQRPRQPKA